MALLTFDEQNLTLNAVAGALEKYTPSKEVKALQKKVSGLIKDICDNLSPWERVQLSRHPNRPHTLDYINNIIPDFHEVAGDRYFANDPAVISGFGHIGKQKVAVVGIKKVVRKKKFYVTLVCLGQRDTEKPLE